MSALAKPVIFCDAVTSGDPVNIDQVKSFKKAGDTKIAFRWAVTDPNYLKSGDLEGVWEFEDSATRDSAYDAITAEVGTEITVAT